MPVPLPSFGIPPPSNSRAVKNAVFSLDAGKQQLEEQTGEDFPRPADKSKCVNNQIGQNVHFSQHRQVE